MRLALRLAIPTAIAGFTLVACATTSTPAATATAAATSAAPAAEAKTLTIKGFAFSPATLTVAKGTKLTITNQDTANHTFSSGANRTKDGKYDTTVAGGQDATITLDQAGTFDIFCQFHSSMKMTLTVQ